MRITNKISLDFSRNTMPPVVQAKQGDVRSRYIEITPLDNGAKWAIPDGISAHFASRKPDGKHVYLDTPVIADGVITVELSDQTLVVAGRSVCDIILLSEDGKILTSQNFFLEVEYSPGAYAELESTDEVQSLYKLIDAIETKLANGEFNGAPGVPGYTPVKGVDYFDGKDGSRWFSGTAVSIDGGLPVYLVSGAKEGDYYLNTTSGNVYRAGSTYWEYEGNIKGRAGDPGAPGTSVTHKWSGTVLTITSASGTSSADLQGPPGEGGTGGGADLSDSAPVMNGEASPGTSEEASRADHVHPTDTSRMPSVDLMATNINPANADYIPVYSSADKDMKRVMWGRLFALVKAAITSVASAETAESLTDPASGYTAVLPELEGNAVLLIKADLAAHNVSEDAHNDIRLLIDGLADRINAVLDSDDATLDELSEIVAYIKANKALIDSITTSKVSVTDIVNNLTTNAANKPLSAAQGVALKALIDAIKVPTKLSELAGDATHRTVTDAEKAAWDAKSDFSGAYADLSGKPTIPTVPTKVSAFTNDAGYIKQAELDAAVDDALTEAKESGEFDGKDGKSAYQYAVDGGYEGTDNDFSHDLSAINKKIEKTQIVNEAGESEELVMSQKGVTQLVNNALGTGGKSEYEIVDSIEEMSDISKQYILRSTGTLWAYGDKTVEDIPNQFVLSESKLNHRISGGGAVQSGYNGLLATNPISVPNWVNPYTVKIRGVTINKSSTLQYYIATSWRDNSDNNLQVLATAFSADAQGNINIDENGDYVGNIYNSSHTDAAQVRFCICIKDGTAITEADIANLFIEFVPKNGTKVIQEWQDTGVVPEDTEGDNFVTLLVKINENTSKIQELEEKVNTASPNSGAVWYAIGDSITYGLYSTSASDYFQPVVGQRWVDYVAKHNGYNLTNLGKSGSGFVTGTTFRTIVNQNDFTGVDLVTIMLGINDWKNTDAVDKVGTMDDDISTGGTIVSELRYGLEKIIGDNPYCKIILITPINAKIGSRGTEDTNWAYGFSGTITPCGSLKSFGDKLKEVCEYYGIQVIDMTNSSVVNRKSITTILPDGIHPNLDCYKALGRELARKITFA